MMLYEFFYYILLYDIISNYMILFLINEVI